MKKTLLLLPTLALMLFMLTSCKEISPKEQIVIYNEKKYEYTEGWQPLCEEFDSVEAYFGEDNEKSSKTNKTVYLLRNCDEKYIRVRIEGTDYYYHRVDDILPSYQNIDSVSEIRIVTAREEKAIGSELYKPIIEHIIQNKDNSYIASNSNNVIGDIIVIYKYYPASQIIGKLVYDDEDNICFSDARLNAFEKYRWVYPFPFDAVN